MGKLQVVIGHPQLLGKPWFHVIEYRELSAMTQSGTADQGRVR